jgi:hydrogenase nickel incorporation protein HypA/HybF
VHEMGIMSEVLVAVTEAAERAGAVRINSVRATVGELTAVVPDSLQFAWEALTPGTLAEGGVLTITETAARSRCLECGTEFGHDRFDRLCPSCGGFACEVLAGNELRIDDVDDDLPDETSGGAAADASAHADADASARDGG